MLKMRRFHDRFIFNMGISIPGKDGLYIETGPAFSLIDEPRCVHCEDLEKICTFIEASH